MDHRKSEREKRGKGKQRGGDKGESDHSTIPHVCLYLHVCVWLWLANLPHFNRNFKLHNTVFIISKYKGFPCGSAGKESTFNVGNLGYIPGLGRSPREGKGYPHQYFGLGNSMNYIVHGAVKSQTWLSDFHFTSLLNFTILYLLFLSIKLVPAVNKSQAMERKLSVTG